MNRRSFFGAIAAFLAGAIGPAVPAPHGEWIPAGDFVPWVVNPRASVLSDLEGCQQAQDSAGLALHEGSLRELLQSAPHHERHTIVRRFGHLWTHETSLA